MFNNHRASDKIGLLAVTTDEEGRKSGYDTFIEKSDYQATATSLLLTGPRNIFNRENNQSNNHFKFKQNGKGHRRALSFGETVDPITLSWQNINVYASIKGTGICGRTYDTGETHQLLHDQSGIVRPGTLLAIMGASGSGKSTLLNVLTYRNRGDLIVEGEVKVNGQPVERGIKALSGYTQQNDLFVGTLKVREHLWFQAQLRMDSHIPMLDRLARIEEVMIEMGLSKCAETFIGIPGSVKSISGGEMKRLSFASEVLTNPPLMFCDEPTSGLDSFMAENVIRTLKAMAAKGKTILCTIHQPSSEVYGLFDRLLLLAGGKVAYLGNASDALDFFQSCELPCPINYNPADHFVYCLAKQPGQEQECQKRIRSIVDRYRDREEYRELTLELREINEIQDTDLISKTEALQNTSPYKASWALQMKALLWRCWLGQARDTNVFAVRVLQTTIMGLIMGSVYFQQKYDEKGVLNFNGALFLFATNMTFTCFYSVLNAFPYELPVFFREHHNGMYRVDTYFLCKNLVEVLVFLILPTILSTCIYWMVGFQPYIQNFLIAWITTVLVAKAAASLGYLLSTACGRIDLCLAFSPPLLLPLMLFGGYMLNLESVTVWIRWVQWFSWFRYAYEILMVTQWNSITNLTCTDNGIYINGTYVPDPHGAPCYSNGTEVLAFYGFNDGLKNVPFNFSMLVLMIVVLRFLGYVALWIRAREKIK